MRPWEILLRRLLNARRWPLPSETEVRRWLAIWAALRETDEGMIRLLMKWPQDRPLIPDNLAEKLPAAFSDLLYGEDPIWTASTDVDQDALTAMTASWPSGLRGGVETQVSEGEVWWRLSTNPALLHPALTFHSRQDVVPLLHGRDVVACAFVSRLGRQTEADDGTVWRHVEINDADVVANFLFRGRRDVLGESVALTLHDETAELADLWRHGIGMLAGRIVNRWGRRPTVGRSIYAGVWPRLLALHEATTIGRENMRLTAKKRVVVPASSARPALPTADDPRVKQAIASGAGIPVQAPTGPSFDAGEDVLVHDPLDAEEGGGASNPFRVLEYSFEADQLIAWLRFEIETICQRCDIVPQFIGSGEFGAAESGTALRVRLIPTTNAAEGVARPWDDELPVITMRAQRLEGLEAIFGGLGRQDWSQPTELPSIERADALPVDESEQAGRLSTLRTAELISIEQGVRERNPDWSDEQVTEEVDRIRADSSATMPSINFGPPGAPPTPPEPPPPPGQQ